MLFLTKLDPARYAPMMAQLTNDAALGRPFPQTLHAAWTISSGWKTATTKIAGGADMHSVFVLADEHRDNRDNRDNKGRGSKGRNPGKGKGDDKVKPRQQQTRTPQTETRTCRGCLKKGHLWADCPDNTGQPDKATALVVSHDPHIDDEELLYEAAFVIDADNITVLFSNTEVLLDNQAGRSIFKNKALLTDVTPILPFFIGGIDGSSKGLRVTEEGTFANLGRVGYQNKAAANILSKAQMLDSGHRVSYNQTTDEYRVEGPQHYTFSRKILPSGQKSVTMRATWGRKFWSPQSPTTCTVSRPAKSPMHVRPAFSWSTLATHLPPQQLKPSTRES